PNATLRSPDATAPGNVPSAAPIAAADKPLAKAPRLLPFAAPMAIPFALLTVAPTPAPPIVDDELPMAIPFAAATLAFVPTPSAILLSPAATAPGYVPLISEPPMATAEMPLAIGPGCARSA